MKKIFFGKGKQRGKRVHYKKYGTFNTFEGKSNKTGIRFFNDVNLLTWKGLTIPVNIDPKNKYEFDALQNEIAYCRIVRKMIRGKYKYYVQIILKGTPPDKRNRKTGEFKNELGNGDVGIDIGTQTIAIVTEYKVQLLELADKVNNIEKAKCRIQRKMDRSRRAMNPDNFNTDGDNKKTRE